MAVTTRSRARSWLLRSCYIYTSNRLRKSWEEFRRRRRMRSLLKSKPSSAIKEMFLPDKAAAIRSTNLFIQNVISYFMDILKRIQKQISTDRFLWCVGLSLKCRITARYGARDCWSGDNLYWKLCQYICRLVTVIKCSKMQVEYCRFYETATAAKPVVLYSRWSYMTRE